MEEQMTASPPDEPHAESAFGAEGRMGVRYSPEKSHFAVVAEAEHVRLRLTHPGTRESHVVDLASGEDEENTWRCSVPGQWLHWSYCYEVERDGKTLGDIVDPWALLVRDGRGYIVHDTTDVTPRPPMKIEDAIIYELHVRDFTRDPACGVRTEWHGKFLGLGQSGTKVAGTAYTSGLDHIVELGVNVVQLMPVHSFALPYHPEYEWGYMPNDFNAPHAGYASSVELDAPIRELKRMVSALHERGLRVTLDVVYNHTAERWPDRLRSMMALAPRTFFRFKNDGTPWDGSACGNEFRSDSAHGRKFIVDSCVYWVREYGIDGFRFDLMGLIDQETMEEVTRALKEIDPTILVYGEPWAGGPTPIKINGKGNQRSRGWAVFNDDFRDGLRGEVFQPKARGFLAEGAQIARVKKTIAGSVETFADSPMEVINYIECHDNHTLLDRLGITAGADQQYTEEQRMEMNSLGAMMLLTSQGIPFLHSGQEFGRTKDGQDNTYNLGDQINNIRWADKSERFRLYNFYRSMIRLRLEHPMFRLRTKEEIDRAIRFLDAPGAGSKPLPTGVIGYILQDVTERDTWRHALLLFNGSRATAKLTIPPPLPLEEASAKAVPARRASDADKPGDRAQSAWRVWGMDGHIAVNHPVAEGTLDLPAHWGAILYIEK